MKGLAIDGLCVEFRILDPHDGWQFRIRFNGPNNQIDTRFIGKYKVEVYNPDGVGGWLGLDEEVNEFDCFEDAYDCLDNYMQGRFRAQGYLD